MGKGDKRGVGIALVVSLGLGAMGEASSAREGASTPQVSVAGFGMRIERAAWLQDHMEHGGRFPMPPSMMPDMPEHGEHRLSVEITLYNVGEERQLFKAAELQLRSPGGHAWLPASTAADSIVLSTGQVAHLFLNFDVPSMREGKLRLVWQRGGTEQAMMAVPPPAHFLMHH